MYTLTKYQKIRYEVWLRRIDAWRLKFNQPLTRQQAIDVLKDDCHFKDGEYTTTSISDITSWAEYSLFIEIPLSDT